MSDISKYPAAQICVDKAKEIISKAALPRVLIPLPGSSELEFASEMSRDGLIAPVLIGREDELRTAWTSIGNNQVEIIDAGSAKEVRESTKQIIESNQVDIILRGSQPVDEVVEVVKGSDGAIISLAVSVVMPGWERFLVISDGGWNLLPTLPESEGIVRNVITLLTALGIETPQIAMLSAVEDIDSRISRTIETASISQMARRG